MGKSRQTGGGNPSDTSLRNEITNTMQYNPNNLKNIRDDIEKIDEAIGGIDEYLDYRADGRIYNTSAPDLFEQVDIKRNLESIRNSLRQLATESEQVIADIDTLVSQKTTDIPVEVFNRRIHLNDVVEDVNQYKDYLKIYYSNTYDQIGFSDEYT